MDRRRRVGAQRPPAPGQRRAPRIDLDDVVYGVHAVDEMLVAGEPLRRIHVGDDRKHDPALRNLLERARAANVPVRFESRAFFASFPYKAHQGVVAFGEPFEYTTLDEVIALRPRDRPALFVVLDHVTDPHNVGAIVRSAECAGATAVILPERRSAGVNATVRKSSAGATAYVPIARVANIAQAVRTLKKAGMWVYGAALGPQARPYTARRPPRRPRARDRGRGGGDLSVGPARVRRAGRDPDARPGRLAERLGGGRHPAVRGGPPAGRGELPE